MFGFSSPTHSRNIDILEQEVFWAFTANSRTGLLRLNLNSSALADGGW
jgi:hypothetical protein